MSEGLASTRRIVSRDEWLAARKAHLAEEKALTRQRDELSRRRRELPWVRVEKDYVFDTPQGKRSLAELFAGRSQLVVYHFMFAPEWTQGCKSCSLLADHYNPAIVHLEHRDVTMVTVSKAPMEKIASFKRRMGWTFTWVSSHDSDFNRDFAVSFTPEELESGNATYNFDRRPYPIVELPGISVFCRDGEGHVYHTYSSYARGLDILLGVYNILDMVPRGRDEENAPGMSWVRHHDRYGDGKPFVDPWVERPARAATPAKEPA